MTRKKLSPSGNYYICFQTDGITDQATQCTKSRALNKVIDSIMTIEQFEQICVTYKGILQSEELKYHIVTIGIDQLLSDSALYENICCCTNLLVNTMNNSSINILLKQTWPPILRGLHKTVHCHLARPYLKNPSARKSMHQLSKVLDVKKKSAVRRLSSSKSKHKAIITGNILWSSIKNRLGHTKPTKF